MRRALFVLIALLALIIPARLHADGPDYSPFAGPWLHHSGGAFTVDADGAVWFEGGGFTRDIPRHEVAQLDEVRFDTAYGHFVDSGDDFWMTVIPAWDVVIMSSGGAAPWTILCGTHAATFDIYPALVAAGLVGASGCGT